MSRYYCSWEEEEAHRKGELDAHMGRYRDPSYDCYFGGDVDQAYCEGYSDEECRQRELEEEREAEAREIEERQQEAYAQQQREELLQEQYEQECYEQQMYEQQMLEQQRQEESYEPPMEQEFSAMQGGTDGG